MADLLVLGIGNLLMGDEGVGIHVARALADASLPDRIAVVDGGTGGFHLLAYLQEYNPVVIVDATMDGRPPGTLRVTMPRFASDFPRSLSAHDVGLRDLVESAALLGQLPQFHLIAVSIDGVQPMRTTLSPDVAAALPGVVRMVLAIGDEWIAATSPTLAGHAVS